MTETVSINPFLYDYSLVGVLFQNAEHVFEGQPLHPGKSQIN